VIAKVRFAAPDRQQHVSGDAEFLLNGRKSAGVLGGELAPLLGKARNCAFLDVIGRRLHKLRLPPRWSPLAPGHIEIGQRKIRLEAAGCVLECPSRDTERLRIGPEVLHPFAKARNERARRVEESRRKQKAEAGRRAIFQDLHSTPVLRMASAAPDPGCNDRSVCTLVNQAKAPKVW